MQLSLQSIATVDRPCCGPKQNVELGQIFVRMLLHAQILKIEKQIKKLFTIMSSQFKVNNYYKAIWPSSQ